jgi:hypothetical protein
MRKQRSSANNERQRQYYLDRVTVPETERCRCGLNRWGLCYDVCFGKPEAGGVMLCGEIHESGVVCREPAGHHRDTLHLAYVRGGAEVTWAAA